MKRYIGLALASLAIGGCDYFKNTQFKQVAVDLGELGEMNNIVKYKDGTGFYLCRVDDDLKVTPLPQEFLNSGDIKTKRKVFYDLDLCESD